MGIAINHNLQPFQQIFRHLITITFLNNFIAIIFHINSLPNRSSHPQRLPNHINRL